MEYRREHQRNRYQQIRYSHVSRNGRHQQHISSNQHYQRESNVQMQRTGNNRTINYRSQQRHEYRSSETYNSQEERLPSLYANQFQNRQPTNLATPEMSFRRQPTYINTLTKAKPLNVSYKPVSNNGRHQYNFSSNQHYRQQSHVHVQRTGNNWTTNYRSQQGYEYESRETYSHQNPFRPISRQQPPYFNTNAKPNPSTASFGWRSCTPFTPLPPIGPLSTASTPYNPNQYWNDTPAPVLADDYSDDSDTNTHEEPGRNGAFSAMSQVSDVTIF